MDSSTAAIGPRDLLVFIDETGVEDYSDPRFPVFGRGGFAIRGGAAYEDHVRRPWLDLKRESLGGDQKPFHSTEFELSKPAEAQIIAINRFVNRPFHRFAVMTNIDTQLPKDIDGHRAVSMTLASHIGGIVSQFDIDNVALFFEASDRGDSLVRRDFDLSSMAYVDRRGVRANVDGYFMPKSSMEPCLEVADLIVHTAGRQERQRRSGRGGFQPDFGEVYQKAGRCHSYFMSIRSVQQD